MRPLILVSIILIMIGNSCYDKETVESQKAELSSIRNFKDYYYKYVLFNRNESPITLDRPDDLVRLHFEHGLGNSYTYCISKMNFGVQVDELQFILYTKIAREDKFNTNGKVILEAVEPNVTIKWNSILSLLKKTNVFLLEDGRQTSYLGSSHFFVLEYKINGEYKEIYFQPNDDNHFFWDILKKFKEVCPPELNLD